MNCIKSTIEFLSKQFVLLSKNKSYRKNSINSINQFTNTLTEVYDNTTRIEKLLILNHKNIKKIYDNKIADEIFKASDEAATSFNELALYFSKFIDENDKVLRLIHNDEMGFQSNSNINFSIENVKYFYGMEITG